MRHYEIVFLVHPDQSEQVPAMIDRYKDMVSAGDGQTHRTEDWGRRRLAYSINDVHKAHYVMFNVECSLDVLREIERNFKFNDSILRHLVIRCNEAITEESNFSKAKAEEDRIEAEKKKSAESRATSASDSSAAKGADDTVAAKGTDDASADSAEENGSSDEADTKTVQPEEDK